MGNNHSKDEEVIINNNTAGSVSSTQRSNDNLSILQIIFIVIGVVLLTKILIYGSIKLFQKIIRKEVSRNAVINV